MYVVTVSVFSRRSATYNMTDLRVLPEVCHVVVGGYYMALEKKYGTGSEKSFFFSQSLLKQCNVNVIQFFCSYINVSIALLIENNLSTALTVSKK